MTLLCALILLLGSDVNVGLRAAPMGAGFWRLPAGDGWRLCAAWPRHQFWMQAGACHGVWAKDDAAYWLWDARAHEWVLDHGPPADPDHLPRDEPPVQTTSLKFATMEAPPAEAPPLKWQDAKNPKATEEAKKPQSLEFPDEKPAERKPAIVEQFDPPQRNRMHDPRQQIWNYGVDTSRFNGVESQVPNTINGRPVSRAQVIDALTNGLPDDSQLLRLTVIGTEAECEIVRKDLESHPELSALKSQLVTQFYRPGDAMVACLELPKGHPTVYLQTPQGEVLAREDKYPGPEAVAQAIRRRQPNYDPSRDPGFGGKSAWNLRLKDLPPWVWAALAGVVGWVAGRPPRSSS